MPQEPIRIEQFWDKNPLVMPWMEKFLPTNLMWQDAMASVVGMFINGCIAYPLSFFIPQNVVTGMICVMPSAYLLASMNRRMARAQRKFIRAKKDDGSSGNANNATGTNGPVVES